MDSANLNSEREKLQKLVDLAKHSARLEMGVDLSKRGLRVLLIPQEDFLTVCQRLIRDSNWRIDATQGERDSLGDELCSFTLSRKA